MEIDKALGIYQLIDKGTESSLSLTVGKKYSKAWHQYYELSDKAFRRVFLETAGQKSLLVESSASERNVFFNKLATDVLEKDEPNLRILISGADEEELLAIGIAARFNFEAIKKFNQTINSMLASIRSKENGYESLIFRVLRIDSMVLATKTLADEHRSRVLSGDMTFIKKLGQAINPKTSDKRHSHANLVRFLIFSIHKSQGILPTVEELVNINRKHQFVVEGQDIGEAFRYHLREYKKLIKE